MEYLPTYISLSASGELTRRKELLVRRLEHCDICPHLCNINRIGDEIARCHSRRLPVVSSYCPHFGEEPLLTGVNGVGNIFFGNCNLRCVYCQNYQISQNWRNEIKHEISIDQLATIFLELQNSYKCHAIGLVSPTHFVPQIIEALEIAVPEGLKLPLIFNTNSYDDIGVLKLLEGIIDIYLPDLKYAEDEFARTYSKISDYVFHARQAISEMYRQVGAKLITGEDGLVKRGLIIRHLILPNSLAGTEETMRFIKDELSPEVTVSLMSQYFSANNIPQQGMKYGEDYILLNRKIRKSEYEKALAILEKYGFENGWIQEYESSGYYIPDFDIRSNPFEDRKDFVNKTMDNIIA